MLRRKNEAERGIGRIGWVVAILDRTLRKGITLRERDIWVKTQMKARCLPADFWDKTARGRRRRTCVDSGTSMGLTEELTGRKWRASGEASFYFGILPSRAKWQTTVRFTKTAIAKVDLSQKTVHQVFPSLSQSVPVSHGDSWGDMTFFACLLWRVWHSLRMCRNEAEPMEIPGNEMLPSTGTWTRVQRRFLWRWVGLQSWKSREPCMPGKQGVWGQDKSKSMTEDRNPLLRNDGVKLIDSLEEREAFKFYFASEWTLVRGADI